MTSYEAYEPPAPNEWVRPSARAVLATLILMGLAGWIFGPGTFGFKLGMCAVTAIMEIWGFNAAVQWARALTRHGASAPLVYWGFVVLSCSGWTVFSLYHALGLISGDMGAAAAPAYVAFTALAGVLPFHEWAIERVETAPKKAIKTPKAEQPASETIELPAAPMPNRGVAKSVARELMRQSPRNASKRRGGMSETRTSERGPPLSEQELRQAVLELTEQGKVVSLRGVAKHLDVPVSRVERSPAKGLLYAA